MSGRPSRLTGRAQWRRPTSGASATPGTYRAPTRRSAVHASRPARALRQERRAERARAGGGHEAERDVGVARDVRDGRSPAAPVAAGLDVDVDRLQPVPRRVRELDRRRPRPRPADRLPATGGVDEARRPRARRDHDGPGRRDVVTTGEADADDPVARHHGLGSLADDDLDAALAGERGEGRASRTRAGPGSRSRGDRRRGRARAPDRASRSAASATTSGRASGPAGGPAAPPPRAASDPSCPTYRSPAGSGVEAERPIRQLGREHPVLARATAGRGPPGPGRTGAGRSPSSGRTRPRRSPTARTGGPAARRPRGMPRSPSRGSRRR